MTIYNRFKQKKSMPYNYEVVEIIKSNDGLYIWDLEKELHKKHRDSNLKYRPLIKFAGQYECFSQLLDSERKR